MRFGGLFAFALLAAPGAAAAQDPAEREAMIREMQERARVATTPGKYHEALDYYIGEWDVELAMVMPGAPPQRSPGRATYEWLIEGRWVMQRVEAAEFMGVPYYGATIIGYDNFARNHVAASVSNVDTALNVVRGVVVDPNDRVTALYGTLDEYTTGELAKPYKVVTRVVDRNHHTIEVWDLGIGPDGAKVLQFDYTRRR
jgi:hypothetical protein